MTITCEQCLYWERREGDCGWCRRMSPGLVAWPESNNDDWCGQATPRDSGSTQPVHEAAQAVVDAWTNLTSLGLVNWATVDKRLVDLREALRRMNP